MINVRRTIVAAAAIAVLAGALPVLRVGAVPRYSARYGQRCGLCHVNPSGGGMRTTYASQQLVPDEIAWRRAAAESTLVPDPQITRSLAIGADFREVYVGSGDGARNLDFFQMQGDLYLAFQLDAQASLYYDRTLTDSYELFGTAYVLPLTGYVKAGRFVPSYGWKFDDHTLYVRDELGLAPPANSDVGVEIGLQPGPLDVQLALLNGARGSTLDTDNRLAQSANAIYRWSLGGVGAGLGAAGYLQSGKQSDLKVGGGYGYLTWRGLAWMGEVDVARREPADAERVTSLVTSHELSFLARQGLELLATYDFFDPDKNYESGAKSRWGVGLHLMPRPYLALDAAYRRTSVDDGPALTGDDFDETVLQLHLVY
jgi:hypothetical protein